MNTKTSEIISKVIVSIVVVLTLSATPARAEPMGASSGGTATNTKISIEDAFFFLEEGDRYVSLAVTRDLIANTTSLNFGYRFPDPNNSNQTIIIVGDQGEIPNSVFTITSTSAHLDVTTPDSYPVTRCVFNNETGEITCAHASPSTFDVTWIKDDSWSFEGKSTAVNISEELMTRSRGRSEIVRANASGTWDEYSGTNMTGFLSYVESATLRLENMMQTSLRFPSLLALPEQVVAARMPSTKVNVREAFGFLYNDAGLSGGVRVWRDEFTQTTTLRFGYAFPDPTDPSRILLFDGIGEIPNSAFSISSASAQLKVTTPDTLFIVRCVITGAIGEPGSFTCAPFTAPVTLDLTWIQDGYGSSYETGTTVVTSGPVTTRSHRQFNSVTASLSGTWNEENEHAGTNMTGNLTNFRDITIDQTNP